MTVASVDERLVARAIGGDADAIIGLVAAVAEWRAMPRHELDSVLDRLALAAAADLVARRTLLCVVHGAGLARPAIAALVTDAIQIDDIEQNVIVAVEGGIAGFEGRSAFRSWLHTVARHEALRALRRLARAPLAADGDENTSGVGQRWSGRLDPAAAPLSSQVVARATIRSALNELTPGARQVIHLRAVEGLSYEEMSERLGIPLNTVRSRLHAARTRLQELLAAQPS